MPLTDRADVWDITVPSVECFSLANGAVVHNSADSFRYMSLGVRDRERGGLANLDWQDRTEPRLNAPPATAWMAG